MISRFLTMGWNFNGRPITEISDMPEGTIGLYTRLQMAKLVNII